MRERLLGLIGTAAYYVRIHTFHSFCNEVIKDFPEKFVSARELEALTEVEQIQIMQGILEALPADSLLKPFGAPYLYQRDCLSAIQDLKREDISPQDFARILEAVNVEDLKKPELKQHQKQQVLSGVYQAYQDALKTRGRYDFEDMILFVVQKFKTDSELLSHYQEQFQYILVDEYQDTNGAQNEVVDLLASFFENPNLFVVGDDKQSIYRFQGASLENILSFYKRYQAHAQLVSLKENYRSQQSILDAAHGLIEHNRHGVSSVIPKLSLELKSAVKEKAQPLQVAALETVNSENYFILTSVQQLIHQGVSPSEIAILYRNNRDVLDLLDLFNRVNLPVRLELGQDILKDTQIHKLIRLLRFIQDPSGEADLFFLLHADFLGFDILEVHRVTREAGRGSLFEKLRGHEIFGDFAQKCLEWKSLSMNRPLMEFFDILIHESAYLDHLMSGDERVKDLNNLNTFFDQIKRLNRQKHDLSLAEFLEHLELLKENHLSLKAQELQSDREAIRLMTAHKSKGLEFEYVFILKCVDKHWGNKRSMNKLKLPQGLLKNDISQDKHEKNEDERRLFYVAMTRAKKQVTLSYAKQNENQRPQTPSLFIQELPTECVEWVDTEPYETEVEDRLTTAFQRPGLPDHSQEEIAFVKALLRNYTMSVTHLNNYLRCPRLFYYRNLLRVPSAMNKHMAFGSAVHDALRDLTLAHQKGPLPSEDYLLQQFEKALSRQVLTEQDRRGSLDYGKQTLAAYYQNTKNELRSNSLPEYNFASHGVNLEGVPLTGKLDKIEILDPQKKTVHVVDYKTGNPDSKSQALGADGEYRRQILFYKLLCDLSPKFPYTMVSGEIDFIQPSSRTHAFKRQRIEPTAEELSHLKNTIKDVYMDIMELRFLNLDEWKTCGECEYCQFHMTSSSSSRM